MTYWPLKALVGGTSILSWLKTKHAGSRHPAHAIVVPSAAFTLVSCESMMMQNSWYSVDAATVTGVVRATTMLRRAALGPRLSCHWDAPTEKGGAISCLLQVVTLLKELNVRR